MQVDKYQIQLSSHYQIAMLQKFNNSSSWWRSGAQHARHLFAHKTPRTALFHARHTLNGAWFAHKRVIKPGGDARDNRPILAGEVALGQRHRGGAPDVF